MRLNLKLFRSSVTMAAIICISALPEAHAVSVFEMAHLAKDAYREMPREPRGQSFTTPAVGTVEFAFSPDQGGEGLVIKVINSARKSIKVASYSYTNKNITRALLSAKQRGVSVWVVADYKDNLTEGSNHVAPGLFNQLVNAGCEVRIDSRYPIFHNKYIIVDDVTLETGSFNFTEAAATKNAENVLVNWNNPALAVGFARQWGTLYQESSVYHPQ